MARRRKAAPRIHLVSLGCAKNLVDSERLLGRFASAGALVGVPAEMADVIVINTCGFLAAARDEARAAIAENLAVKSKNPAVRVLVMGCFGELDAEGIRREFPALDGVFGLGQQQDVLNASGVSSGGAAGRLLLTPSHTAFLRISEGCDNRCAYCLIPTIRGPFRSRPFGDVVAEGRDLDSYGVKELNLIGQDTTLYGSDLNPKTTLAALVRELDLLDGVEWLRILYTHPAHFADDLVDAYQSVEHLVPYVDLPLQHLADPILARMGRHVTREACLRLIERLRAKIPGMVIRTTFIAGFPGETDVQFMELLEDVRRIRFDHVGVFAFSREPGTAADAMDGQIPEAEALRRVEALMLEQQRIVAEGHRERIGQSEDVLIDGWDDESGLWIGRTMGQAPDVDGVTLVDPGDAEIHSGDLIAARIRGADGYDLLAEAELLHGSAEGRRR
ncbi:30S ribosomal protein S12 methylthiotransferase RimO [Candidatus Bipolaricaulota bacterium]|nr:30S ribosomal protein S12 methylthiotransferase RimO [Candidatus Bipolaricaulota bacterium]